ncbi:MAG: nicotinamide mononucleotide transporter [Clostridia bacterium]|nr:nicotinamide mononucleotide transporter [Clostridia bacterium]
MTALQITLICLLGAFLLAAILLFIYLVDLNKRQRAVALGQPQKENIYKRLWKYFTPYEKIWFISITVLAIVFAIVFPEEDFNGVNGGVILALYLADIFLNILCELLISKQSKWNFIVSLGVELTEIATLIVLASRFATMAVTIFFWIPIDIISFVNWNRHKDKKENELTVVRKLNWWQDIIVVASIALWTLVIGYMLTWIDLEGIYSYNEVVQDLSCYLDACASAIGIANGVFILLRYREQWIAWYLVTFLEIALNILAGQWILLVLKAGYLTNTTYGYIKWTKYIKSHPEVLVSNKKKKIKTQSEA